MSTDQILLHRSGIKKSLKLLGTQTYIQHQILIFLLKLVIFHQYVIQTVNYLVFNLSQFSADDMRAYKSLGVYNQVIECWVRDVKVMTTSGLKVVKGKVISLISLNLFLYVFPSYEIYLAIKHFSSFLTALFTSYSYNE